MLLSVFGHFISCDVWFRHRLKSEKHPLSYRTNSRTKMNVAILYHWKRVETYFM